MKPLLAFAADIDATVLRYPGVLSPDECQRIVEASGPYAAEHRDEHEHVMTHPVDDIDARLGQDVAQRLYWVVHHANTELTGWRIPIDISRFGVSRYQPGHYMSAHVDDEDRAPTPALWDLPHRGISMSIPLSPPGSCEGGRLQLLVDGQWATVGLGRGDAVLFGSSLLHKVTPVTAGERWTLLAWCYTNHIERALD